MADSLPGAESLSGAEPPDAPVSPNEFAAALRSMHPEFADEKDDHALTSAMLEMYPEFKGKVTDPASLQKAPRPGTPPPPMPQMDASKPAHIGADPGGRPFIPSAGEFGFEAGLARLTRGVKNVAKIAGSANPFDTASRVAADVVGGGMSASEPLLLPAAAAAPIPTAAAVVVGTIAQKAVDKTMEWFHLGSAPVRELAGDIAAIVAGGKAAHGLSEGSVRPVETRSTRAQARFGATEDTLQAQFGEGMRDKENLQSVEATMEANRRAAVDADTQARQRRVSRIALDAAKQMDKAGKTGAGPFAYLDTIAYQSEQLTKAGQVVPGVTGPPLQLPSPDVIESFRNAPPTEGAPPRPMLPEQAGPAGAETRPTIYAAEAGAQVESVGERAPRVSQPTPPDKFASDQLGALIESAQNDHDRLMLEAQQERYRQAHYEGAQDIASELEGHGYDRTGKTVETAEGNTVTRAVSGTPIYNRIVEPVVGKAVVKVGGGPPRELIASIARAYADTGAKSSAELPGDYLPSSVKVEKLADNDKAYFTSRGFRNQFDRYIKYVIGTAESRAAGRVATGEPTADVHELTAHLTGEPPPEVPGMAAAGGPVAAQAAAAPAIEGEMPPGWLGLPDEAQGGPPGVPGDRRAQPRAGAFFIGYQETGVPDEPFLPLYNMVGGVRDGSTVTGAQLGAEGIAVPDTPTLEDYQADPSKYRPTREMVMRLKADLATPAAEPGAPPAAPTLPGMFDRLAGEEGHLILNVRPGDRAGLEAWYEKQRGEYQGEDWFEKGILAMRAGDFDAAYQAANVAAARSGFLATSGATQGERRSPEQLLRFKEGEPLPKPIVETIDEAAASAEARRQRQVGLYDRLKGEQGALVLDVRPNDRAGLRKWYKDKASEYGDEEWYQAGISAMEAGDFDSAYRVAAVTSARSFATAAAAQEQRRASGAGAATNPMTDDMRADIKTSVEKALGGKLPGGTTIGEGGIVKLPGNPGGLDPKYTDLVLGKNLVGDLVDLVDPSTIIRVEDNEGKLPSDIPKELRISYQMADQILRQMPDDVLEPFLDQTGLDRPQAAAHLARAASQAGKTLATFKHWQDAHWDEILHLNPELAGTRGPGAAGRLEFVPEERQAQILTYLNELKAKGQLKADSAQALKDMGFELPKDIRAGTDAARTYTRRWLTKQRRLAEMAKTLDIAAKSGDDFDRQAAATALGMKPERSVAGQIFDDVFGRARQSFMLSQASTAMKILESHGLRYNLGTLEEVLTGVASRLMGKHDDAAQHFNMAKEMSSLKPGTFPTGLAKRPWTDSLGDMFNYTMESVSGLAEDDRRRALATLDSFPREEARMTGAALLSEPEGGASKVPGLRHLVDPRVRNLLTVGIRAQAASIRSALYDATLRSHLIAEGVDPSEILGKDNPGQALVDKFGEQRAEQMVGSGVAAALNYTYAGRPLPDSLPGKVIDTMTSLPVVSTMLRLEWAFPRFQFATVPRWIWDRVPGTLIYDMLAKKVGGVGRLAKGAERVALEQDLMPTQLRELNTARYDSAKALQDTMAARLDAHTAAKALKGYQAKSASGEILPEVRAKMDAAAQFMQEKVGIATKAAQDHRAAEARVSDLSAQLKQSQSRAGQLQEIDAPSFEQYLARQAVGVGLLMPLALAMRNSKGAEDTEYYQYKVGGKPMDMRPFLAGFGPFLLYADFYSDVVKNTEWKQVATDVGAGAGFAEAFGQNYQGRYTDRKLLADTMEAWLTIHPLFGTASWLMDALSGRQAEGEGSKLHSMLDEFLATTGQAIGSFFLPLQTVSDIAGAVVPQEATARTPERPGQYTGAAAELTEPAISHIPGVREQIPERISPFTGEPRQTEHPALHQLLGTTFGPEATDVQREVTRTGLKPGLALPRVSGDAEFDNRVNKAYAQVLKENFGDLLGDPDYQKLPTAHRRDILETVFKSLKGAAYSMVADQVSAETALGHLRPDKMAKMTRWVKLLEKWAKEEAPEGSPQGQSPEGGPPGAGADPGGPPLPPF